MQPPHTLTALPTASVHEAAGRIGALPARLSPAYSGAALIGPAFTVSCPSGDNLRLHHAIQLASPGDVLVVAIEGDREYGFWGEILSEAAKARGLAGLVIDGGVRDTAVLGEVGFPVFSSLVTIKGTGKNPALSGSIGRHIRIGDVVIAPGDYIVGDADGVCVIPSVDMETVRENTQLRDLKEADTIREIRAGRSTLDLYNLPDLPDLDKGVKP